MASCARRKGQDFGDPFGKSLFQVGAYFVGPAW